MTHVPHPEDAGGQPLGVKLLEGVQLFTDADELDRLADGRTQRERRTAASIPVHFREDGTVEIQTFVERLRHRHGVLAGHCIDHEEDLVRGNRCLDGLDFLHHLFVDVEPACGINNHNVPRVLSGMLHGMLGDRPGCGPRLLVDGNADLLPQRHQLIDGRRPMNVSRRKHRMASLPGKIQGQFGAKGRFPGTLQSRHQNDRRRHRGEENLLVRRPEQPYQLVINDLDDQLPGSDALEHLLPDRPLQNVVNELLGDLVVDVGIQQHAADFAQRFGDVGFGNLPLPA